jgi:DNA-3-methyladenine glycosylase II
MARCTPQILQGDEQVMPYLIRSVISQQLSTAAARTIYQRFVQLVGDQGGWQDRIRQLPGETLRACGLSAAKCRYVQGIVSAFEEGNLHSLPWQTLSDEEILAQLLPIPGVGKWTVEMVLIFCLNREDVLPIGDLVIRQQMVRLYQLSGTGSALQKQLHDVGEAWRPHRTLASRYLWAWNDCANKKKVISLK